MIRTPMIPGDHTNKVITCGGLDKTSLRKGLSLAGVLLNPAAETLFEDARFKTSPVKQTLKVVFVTPAQLGLSTGAFYAEIVARAKMRGLQEGPLELGPHLRLQFLDQQELVATGTEIKNRAPLGSITVASQALDDSDETPKGFYLRCLDSKLWLRAYRASPDHPWQSEDVFAFVAGEIS